VHLLHWSYLVSFRRKGKTFGVRFQAHCICLPSGMK
jgi:hypothetical protein